MIGTCPDGRESPRSAKVLDLVVTAVLAAAVPAPWAPFASAAVLAQDDFEQTDTTCWGRSRCAGYEVYGAGTGTTSIAVDGIRHSGSRALRVAFTRNEQAGGASMTIEPQEHLFTRYYDYYDQGFDFACGMKVHRLTSQTGEFADFDVISYSTGDTAGAGADYCGTNPMSGLHVGCNGGPHDWGSLFTPVRFERGRWTCVEHEIVLNQVGQSDGLVRLWVDGVLAGEKLGLFIRDASSQGVNRVLFGGWYSNGCAGRNPCVDPATESVRYIDDVVIANERIGCSPVDPVDPDPVDPAPDGGRPSAGVSGGCASGAARIPAALVAVLVAVAFVVRRPSRRQPR